VELLVICFFFGLSAATIAKIKGGSFLIWFLIGFALPIVGTIAALLYRSERAVPRRRCPECGKVLPVHDQVCRRCGADLAYPEP
jgi:hypothetical protein